MTSRLSGMFDACRQEERSALIGYLPTGYPDVPVSISAMTALVESGCDVVEVGMPYSDPGMDGPTIATATEAALRGGVRVRDSLAAVEAISRAGGPDDTRSTTIARASPHRAAARPAMAAPTTSSDFPAL